MREINNQIQFIIKPLSFFLLFSLILILTAFFAVKQINDIRAKISNSKRVESSLNTKISTLQKVDKKISENITFLDIALPSRASALYAINQIKVNASKYNVLVSNLRTGSSSLDDGSISTSLVSFDVDGKIYDLYNYLESFSKVLPIMNVTKTTINLSGDIAKASVSISVYSATLPTQISAIAESVNDLTPEEENLLSEIANYELPSFVEPKPQEGLTKEDPFN